MGEHIAGLSSRLVHILSLLSCQLSPHQSQQRLVPVLLCQQRSLIYCPPYPSLSNKNLDLVGATYPAQAASCFTMEKAVPIGDITVDADSLSVGVSYTVKASCVRSPTNFASAAEWLQLNDHPHALPNHEFAITARSTNTDGHKGQLVLSLSSGDIARVSERMCEYFKSDPLQLRAAANSPNLADPLSLKYAKQALQRIFDAGMDEYEENRALLGSVEKEIEKMDADQRTLQKDFQNAYKALFLLASPGRGGFADNFDKVRDGFFTLRRRHPTWFTPFQPMLVLYWYSMCPPDQLKLLKDAAAVDPLCAYVLVMTRVRFAITSDRGDQPANSLCVIAEVFPKDICVRAFIDALDKEHMACALDFSPVALGLANALTCLFRGGAQIEAGIDYLELCKRHAPGLALPYRWLAIASALSGGWADSEKLLERAARGLDLRTLESAWANDVIIHLITLETTGAASPPAEQDDPLRRLVKCMAGQSVDAAMAQSMLLICDCALDPARGRCESQLPLVLLFIRWLHPHVFASSPDWERWLPVCEAASKLLCRAAALCFIASEQVDERPLDAWVKDHFERVLNGDKVTFVVDFSEVTFGLPPPPPPHFELDGPTLELTDTSFWSVSTHLTKALHSLITGLMIAGAAQSQGENLGLHLIEQLPDEASVSNAILKNTNRHGNWGAAHALFVIAKYERLRPEERRYELSSSLLAWSKFSVFATHAKPLLSFPEVDQLWLLQLVEVYLPSAVANELEETEKRVCARGKEILLLFEDSRCFFDMYLLDLRDALLAHHWLQKRAADDAAVDAIYRSILAEDQPSLWSLFRVARHLFCWRAQEELAAWGSRLSRSPFAGTWALYSRSAGKVKACDLHGSPAARRGMSLLLECFITLQKGIAAKNAVIEISEAAGGKFSSPQRLPLHKWRHIVSTNAPKSYPDWTKLSVKDQQGLTSLVGSKNEHERGVTQLKTAYEKLQTACRGAPVLASVLLTIARYKREKSRSKHSLFTGSADRAKNVFRLLLEVGLERIMRDVIEAAGSEHWLLQADVDNFALKEFKERLQEFGFGTEAGCHGPEEHKKNGPLHPHYNAPAVFKDEAGKMHAENTHIYA
ncbi:hypothetical protein DFJ77DRAFT_520495 [Powellomyces hirtus]|nr:hypothetical protein DFJ77DRAFT_520495 [Powellomyces hirtus]